MLARGGRVHPALDSLLAVASVKGTTGPVRRMQGVRVGVHPGRPSDGATLMTPVERRSRRVGMARSTRVRASTSSESSVCTSPAQWIEDNLQTGPITDESFQGGSQWSSAYVLKSKGGQAFFVKTARGRDESMFRGEALGLQAMRDTETIGVPKVFHYGLLNGPGRPGSFIVMFPNLLPLKLSSLKLVRQTRGLEYLDLSGSADQSELGRQLALMHLATPKDPQAASGKFGFSVDNTIGGTHQPNTWGDNWVDFFREQRLGHMLQLAGDIKPSVLHGDLWSGNIGGDRNGQPIIFDPAVYYGHHEAEFGMMWCAGFNQSFWKAYHSVIPRAHGWEERNQLYQLYHYLNHAVLFGGGYYGTSARIMQSLISKL